MYVMCVFFFFSSRRRHTRLQGDWSSDVCSSDLFEPRDEADAEPDAPAIFIGNGSGYAGLRGHLLARMHAGRHRNWLLFGERQRAHDGYCEAEVSGWLAAGKLQDRKSVV